MPPPNLARCQLAARGFVGSREAGRPTLPRLKGLLQVEPLRIELAQDAQLFGSHRIGGPQLRRYFQGPAGILLRPLWPYARMDGCQDQLPALIRLQDAQVR